MVNSNGNTMPTSGADGGGQRAARGMELLKSFEELKRAETFDEWR